MRAAAERPERRVGCGCSPASAAGAFPRQVQGALGPTLDRDGLGAEVAVGHLVESEARVVRKELNLDGFLDLLLGRYAGEAQLGAAPEWAGAALPGVTAELEVI